MKHFPIRAAGPLLGFILSLNIPSANATSTASAQLSFNNLSITPASGSLVILSNWQSSAFAQATTTTDFHSGSGLQSANAAGDFALAHGEGNAVTPLGLNVSGQSSASGSIFGNTEASDTAAGRGNLATFFMISGPAGTVSTTFSIQLNGSLSLFTDNFGESAEAETIFSLEVDGAPQLFHNQLFSIGPNDSVNSPFSTTLNQLLTLDFNTPYYLYAEADSEVRISNIPEPRAIVLIVAGIIAITIRRKFSLRNRHALPRILAILGIISSAAMTHAAYIGSEPPAFDDPCAKPGNRQQGGNAQMSLSEGNFREDYHVVSVQGGNGGPLVLTLTYNSYNADGSRAQVDCGLGIGWTHSFNIFLFSQRSHFFRMDGEGRVTQYRYGAGGVYSADPGYFETLTPQPDGSYILTNKFQNWWRFALVPNTHFSVNGQVYRLTQMGDRNQNLSTLLYTNGVLAVVSNHDGRTLSFGYTNSFKLATVIDPLGRVTRFQYDPQFREPTRMTDRDGKTTRYTYNSLYQMTRKIDRDGRMYFYTYKFQKPFSVMDGDGQTLFSLSNPLKWSTDRNMLSQFLRRQYDASTTTETNGLGGVWRYTYDTNGYITRVIAPNGATTLYSYNSGRQLAATTNANGAVTRYFYDARGNRTNVTDSLGNVTTYQYDGSFNQVTNIADPNGRVTRYQYDSSGNLIRRIDAANQTNLWTYDARGDVISETDARGHVTTYTYDTRGNRTNTTDAAGNVTTFQYDAMGNRIATTDALGRTTTYTYDARDRMIASTNAQSGVEIYQYDGLNRRVQETDRNGNTTTYNYDTRGRSVEIIDAAGNNGRSAYDANDNRTALTNRNGFVTQYTYDAHDRLIRTTNALGNVTYTSYDAVGNVVSQTDAASRTTTYTYDSLNRLIRMTNALGGVTRYDYAAPGGPPCCSPTVGSPRITREEDPNGKVTFYKYDAVDRLTQIIRKVGDTNDVIDLDDAVTTYSYDSVGNRISETQPNGNTTIYAYDSLNRRTNAVNAGGDITRYFYDGVGNLTRTIHPNGNITTNAYDSLNRVTSMRDEVGLITAYTYDPVGNRLAETNANSSVTTYSYDTLNRRVTETDPLGRTTTYSYDGVGNLTTNVDRAGHVTTYMYDGLNRRTATIDALGNSTMTSYDAVGNVTNITDANGRVTTYVYDGLNRRISETYPDATPNTITYSYDPVGNVTNRTDQQGRVTTYQYSDLYQRTNRTYTPSGINDGFTYDKSGRLLGANRAGWVTTYTYDGADRLISSVQNGRTITYSYDIAGRSRTNTYPGGRTIIVTNDARTRPISLHDGTANPPITTYTYDSANRVLTRGYRNGIVTTYTYDADDRMTSAEHFLGITRIVGFGYDHDFDGNRLYEEKRHLIVDSEAYQYDANHRLTNYSVGTLVGPVVPSPSLLKSWYLDPVGNWMMLVSNTIPELRAHNTANELTNLNGSTFFYDDSGNLQQDTAYSYAYDEENRLTQVTRLSDSAVVGRYYYDALGRRVVKVANPAGVSTTNLYFYDGVRLLEEQTVGGATVATYTYGNYVDEVLTMDRAGQTYFYHQNGQWSPHALTDSSANVVERYLYDAYGCVTVLDGAYTPLPLNAWGTAHSTVTNSFLFTGREFDEETGLHHYRARTYDCGKGRFLQRDPLGYVDGMNLYEYARGNPINRLDPRGLDSESIGEDAAKLSDKEKLAKSEERVDEMKSALKRVERLQEDARKEKDLIRLDCISEKIREIRGLLSIAMPAHTALQQAIKGHDISGALHAFVKIQLAHIRARDLAVEAEKCLGEGSLYSGDPGVDVTIDGDIPDPTEPGFGDLPVDPPTDFKPIDPPPKPNQSKDCPPPQQNNSKPKSAATLQPTGATATPVSYRRGTRPFFRPTPRPFIPAPRPAIPPPPSRPPRPAPVRPQSPPSTDAFSQAPPAGGEAAASANPQMLGD